MVIKNRNLFRITRFILLRLPPIFKFFSRFRPAKNRLLVIKTDAIGDYILFRNYLEILHKSEKYNDYHITLLGNELWQDIALKYDSQFVDDFIFIGKNTFYERPLATLTLALRLFKNNYQIVLQASYTRHLITDGLAALTGAKQIIGFESDNEAIVPRYKQRTDSFYTQKLTPSTNVFFEFERTRFFFESVLVCPIAIEAPIIPIKGSHEEGIVILPGAGIEKRRWEKEKFRELLQLICQNTDQPIYLAGKYSEAETGDFLMRGLPAGRVTNLIGKTNLIELIELIGNAALVIANETGAIHIAAATNTTAVCVLGGGHYGRFAPYVVPVAYKPLCVSEKMECYNCNWECKFSVADGEPFPCVAAVGVEKVWEEVLPLLSDFRRRNLEEKTIENDMVLETVENRYICHYAPLK